ncbi:hypothetical protein [Companilactobacillus futsaii]|uniref:Lipoprotein n=2 Tax=Companilactobacillus futsaii TaxID=938155 RepID=A0A5B7SYV9_9LACO|nr:hypothetical protein [Companilactobacillus futsaii]KRK91808.1 hypothetical protein FC88_GL001022 [Companilactobacillus futsaii JCM 17355]QCX24818.1 hypothetical protein FG051_06695 [Companilactobacillus futsaii]
MKIYLATITVCALFLTGCSQNTKTSNIDQADLQKQQIVLKRNKKNGVNKQNELLIRHCQLKR